MKIVIFTFMFAMSSSAFASEFIGCWPTTQVGMVTGNQVHLVYRSSDTLWLHAEKIKSKAVLNYAALVPMKGWSLCIEGSLSGSDVKVEDAFICTSDHSVSPCDPDSRIASSKLF